MIACEHQSSGPGRTSQGMTRLDACCIPHAPGVAQQFDGEVEPFDVTGVAAFHGRKGLVAPRCQALCAHRDRPIGYVGEGGENGRVDRAEADQGERMLAEGVVYVGHWGLRMAVQRLRSNPGA